MVMSVHGHVKERRARVYVDRAVIGLKEMRRLYCSDRAGVSTAR